MDNIIEKNREKFEEIIGFLAAVFRDGIIYNPDEYDYFISVCEELRISLRKRNMKQMLKRDMVIKAEVLKEFLVKSKDYMSGKKPVELFSFFDAVVDYISTSVNEIKSLLEAPTERNKHLKEALKKAIEIEVLYGISKNISSTMVECWKELLGIDMDKIKIIKENIQKNIIE